MRTPLQVITSALDTDDFTVEDLMDVRLNAEVSRQPRDRETNK